jgi:hypothetical protein
MALFAQATPDAFNPGIRDTHSDHPERRLPPFVDDTGPAHIRHPFLATVAASIYAHVSTLITIHLSLRSLWLLLPLTVHLQFEHARAVTNKPSIFLPLFFYFYIARDFLLFSTRRNLQFYFYFSATRSPVFPLSTLGDCDMPVVLSYISIFLLPSLCVSPLPLYSFGAVRILSL